MKKICIVTTMWTSINNWFRPIFNYYKDLDVDIIKLDMDFLAPLYNIKYGLFVGHGVHILFTINGSVRGHDSTHAPFAFLSPL